MAWATIGEAIWTAQLLTLGWWFGQGWIALLDYLDDAVTVLTALAVAAGLVWLLVRLLRSKPEPSQSAERPRGCQRSGLKKRTRSSGGRAAALRRRTQTHSVWTSAIGAPSATR